MKRFIIMFITALLIFALAVSSYAYSITDYSMITDNFITVCDSGGAYMLGWSGSELSAERIAPYSAGGTLSLSHNIITASVFDGTAAALCIDDKNDQLIVYTYDIDSNKSDSFALTDTKVDSSKGFYYDGYSLYTVDSSDERIINRYTSDGSMYNSFTFANTVSAIIRGRSGGNYAISGGRLYQCNSDSYTLLSGSTVRTPATFIGDDILSDGYGGIYRVTDRVERLFGTGSGTNCVCGDQIFSADKDVIYGYDMNGNKRTYFNSDTNIMSLYSYNVKIYALSYSAQSIIISPDEFSAIRKESANKDDNPVKSYPIASDIYDIDYTEYRIYGIPSGTTFAQFKRNVSYDGYDAKLYRSSRNISSGKIGTAMTAVFSNSHGSYTFELSVIGDITGEGNVNSRDVGRLIDYLLGDVNYNGVYLASSDVSGDGAVDMIDLAMLCRMNKKL